MIDDFKYDDDAEINVVIDRFNNFLTANSEIRTAFVTLTHIARNPFSTQAFSFSRWKEKKIDEHFLPKNPGGRAWLGYDA